MTSSPKTKPTVPIVARLLRLRMVLIVPFVLQVLLIVGLVGFLSFRSGQRAVYDLVTQLRQELGERIARELRGYVDLPPYFNQINAVALARDEIDYETNGNIFLLQQEIALTNFISIIYCAKETGEHTAAGRFVHPDGTIDESTLISSISNAGTQFHLHRYKLDNQGTRTEFIRDHEAYDPRVRPWYRVAVEAGGPTWGDVFLDLTTKLPTVPASRPVYNEATGELIGVCSVGMILPTHLRQFLASLQIGKTGKAFITDRTGAILASSTGEPLTVGEGDEAKLIQATESSEPLVRETARFLQAQFGDVASIDQMYQLDFDLNGERQFMQATPFRDQYGLDWLIVITVPEADFMEQINANTRMTILLCLAALLLALLVGIFTARWLTGPILRIADASAALAGGNLDQHVQPSPVVELGRLGNAFNSMAQQLKQAFASLQASEKKFRSLYEDSKDAIFIAQADGTLLDINPAGLRLFALSADAVATTNTKDFFVRAEDSQRFRAQVEGQGAVSDFEVQLHTWDGAPFDALITATQRHDEAGAPAGYQGLIRDITLQKQNERLRAENMRMGAEIDVTRRLQSMILPASHELEAIHELDIAGYMAPADEVGGDYYDVLRENGMVKIGIGDVTDHGLESGVVMLMTQTAVRTLLHSGETDPVRFLDVLNRTVYGNVQRMQTDRNLTLSLIDYAHGQLRLSGQHEELILIRQNGTVELVDTSELGFPIGLYDEAADFFHHTTLALALGDGFVLYTDGITEAENALGEQYGLDRLCAVAKQHWEQPAEQIKEAVIADVRCHIGEHQVYDDITLVVVKQK